MLVSLLKGYMLLGEYSNFNFSAKKKKKKKGVKNMTFFKDVYCVNLDQWTARLSSQQNASEFVI